MKPPVAPFLAALLSACLLAVPPGAQARTHSEDAVPRTAAQPTKIVRTVVHDGVSLTLRLQRVSTRAPGFEVLVQQGDGSLREVAPPAARSYLGSVDGRPGAIATGIITSTGAFDGQVVFNRGATWRFLAGPGAVGTVYDTRGTTPTTAFAWPSASDPQRNVTLGPGQVGRTTYRWDLGVDGDSDWFLGAPVNGSVPLALDAIELSAVSLLGVYQTNALLRPALGRVILRGSAARDPYAAGATLDRVRTEWNSNQTDAETDAVTLLDRDYGGGVAWVAQAGAGSRFSLVGGAGASRNVLRHELGHTWGAYDNHTNGPEGRTIMSGNAVERFDGTELAAMVAYRDRRQADSGPFTPTARFAIPVPPYAGLDLVRGVTSGVRRTFWPTRNDHDANLDRLTLVSVGARSHLGGRLVRSGNAVAYSPPRVTTTRTDWVTYVVRDATGRFATGVALFRVRP